MRRPQRPHSEQHVQITAGTSPFVNTSTSTLSIDKNLRLRLDASFHGPLQADRCPFRDLSYRNAEVSSASVSCEHCGMGDGAFSNLSTSCDSTFASPCSTQQTGYATRLAPVTTRLPFCPGNSRLALLMHIGACHHMAGLGNSGPVKGTASEIPKPLGTIRCEAIRVFLGRLNVSQLFFH
jgi:hypothetical protein